jgi:hypothetical protein
MIRRHYSIERMPLVNAIALNEIRPFVPKLLQEVSRGVQSETQHAW